MSVSVDAKACTGCGACVRVCPGNLLVLDAGGRAHMRSPKDCWGCTACLKECPADAICYFLGADVGGRGTRLSVSSRDGVNEWVFRRADGTETLMRVDRTQSNRY